MKESGFIPIFQAYMPRIMQILIVGSAIGFLVGSMGIISLSAIL